MRIILHPLAEAELLEAVSFYENRALGLGQDFILDFERTLSQIFREPRNRYSHGYASAEGPLPPLPFQRSLSPSR